MYMKQQHSVLAQENVENQYRLIFSFLDILHEANLKSAIVKDWVLDFEGFDILKH